MGAEYGVIWLAVTVVLVIAILAYGWWTSRDEE